MRIIKKYPNRRLYDTEDSKYITLENIRKLVVEEEPLLVEDAKTGKNLTRNILLQIIIEKEQNATPFFSINTLTQIIRFYETSARSLVGSLVDNKLNDIANTETFEIGDKKNLADKDRD